jgi:hypothetical protein
MNPVKASKAASIAKGAGQYSMGTNMSKVLALAGRELAKHENSKIRRNNLRRRVIGSLRIVNGKAF